MSDALNDPDLLMESIKTEHYIYLTNGNVSSLLRLFSPQALTRLLDNSLALRKSIFEEKTMDKFISIVAITGQQFREKTAHVIELARDNAFILVLTEPNELGHSSLMFALCSNVITQALMNYSKEFIVSMEKVKEQCKMMMDGGDNQYVH